MKVNKLTEKNIKLKKLTKQKKKEEQNPPV